MGNDPPTTPLALLLGALLTLPTSALAQTDAATPNVDPTAAALAAAEALEAHCSDVASSEGTAVAAATQGAAEALTVVRTAYETSQAPYLLYWSGRLYHCITNVERAEEDLSAFVAAAKDDPVYSTQVRIARRHLARIERARVKASFAPPPPGAWALAGGLLGAGGGLVALAGWQGSQMRAEEAPYRDQADLWETRVGHLDAALQHQDAANTMFALAGGVGLGAVASLLISSGVEARGETVGVSALVVLPGPEGVGVGFGGRW